MLDEIFKLSPQIIQAISIAITAYFAVRSLRAWRIQLVGKRRFEVAEQTIVAAYKAKEALSWIRSPLSWSTEAKERPREKDEVDSQSRQRDAYFVPFKRMKDTADDFAELQKVRLLCKVHFGEEAVKQIDILFRARTEVRVAAETLSDAVGQDHYERAKPDFYKECRRKIWAAEDDKDLLTKSINAALDALEKLLTPFLK